MRITYDTEMDALTLVVTREDVERTVDVGKGRLIDLDEEGRIVAIEILDVSHGFELDDLVGRFDLKPMFEEFVEHLKTARDLWREDSALRSAVAG